ncbi:hypothetical protein XI06_15990 [Bradyrhizobium sp. CCBAU 11434]|nr:hypothetical protein [Bradyrhizobium sp. CCBAU 11434]
MATACTNLRSLQFQHTVINSADDNATGTFVPPGGSPITGLPAFDALLPLVKWVEGGTAPDTILATKYVADTPPTVQMTRPLCVFPKVAKYNGSGDTNNAANFTCVADENDFNQKPAPKYGP